MTAIPGPPLSRLQEHEDAKLFEESSVKKSLTAAFDTPAIVKKRVSRLSQNFQQLNAEFIKVFLRLRPFTEKEEKENEDQKCMKISDDQHILTVMAPKESKTFKTSNRGIGESVRHYTFTKIFDPTTGQREFYNETAHPLVQEFIDGNNALIFTYGVTNSGKTYTLQGTQGNEGIIPQAIEVLFNQIGDKMLENVSFAPKMATNLCSITEEEMRSRDIIKEEIMSTADETRTSFGQKLQTSPESSGLASTMEVSSADITVNVSRAQSKESFGEIGQATGPVKYAVFVSFVEVYKELVYDLLAPLPDDKRRTRRVLAISDDKKGTAYVKGMREIQVNTPEELLKVLSVGQSNLHVAATKLNKDSSRSHCIFTITLVQVMDIPEPHGARVSKISFCDLAGSERVNKTGEAGDRLKEAGKINNSLMKLGMCISDLRHNQKYKDEKSKQKAIFFRESKLTRLFRNYLLGAGRACMIVNANMCASGVDENIHVMKFSAIAREIQIINKPKRSEVKKKSRATLFDEEFESSVQAKKQQRVTIAWEKKLSPVKDEDEDDLEEESQEEEEEGSDVSESDSDEEEQSVECDVSYWKNREKKYLELIEMLKKAVLQEKKKNKDAEAEIRSQCAGFMHNQIVEIEQIHKDQVDDTIETLMEEQKSRLQVMANIANINMKELKEGFEKKYWDLTAKNTAMEKELSECQEQISSKSTDLLSAEEKVASLELQVNEFKMELEKKGQELAASKRRSMRSSRYSSGGLEKEEAIKALLEENEEGKVIIQSLMDELEQHRSQVESTQEESEKLQEELEKLTKKNESLLTQNSDAEVDKTALDELKDKLHQKESVITKLEKRLAELDELNDQQLHQKENEITELKKKSVELSEVNEKLHQKESEITQLKKKSAELDEVNKKLLQNESEVAELEKKSVELDKLKDKLHQEEREITELEKKSSVLVKNDEIFDSDIDVEEEGLFRFTEAILHTLPDYFHKKDDQITQLTTDIEREVEDKLAIKERLSATTVLLEEATIKTDSLSESLAAKNAELQTLVSQKTDAEKSFDEKIERLNEEIKDLKKSHEKKLGSVNEKLEESQKELAELISVREKTEKEAVEQKAFEQRLVKETERLHSELEQLQKKNLEAQETNKKRTSDASDMLRDVEILTKDRNDLLERVESLRKKLTEATKEKENLKEELRENIANTTSVQNNTEILELKTAVSEKENEIKKLLSEKEDHVTNRNKLQQEIVEMQKSVADAEKARNEEKSRFLAENEECQNLVSQLKESTEKLTHEITKLHEQVDSLTRQRSDLLKSAESVKKEVETKEGQIAALEMKNKNASDGHDVEKAELRKRQKELEVEIAAMRENLKEIQEERDSNKRLRKASEEEKSDLEGDLTHKNAEFEKLKTSFAEFKKKTTDHIDQEKKDHESELKSLKDSHGKEHKHLQFELTQSRKTADAREKELSNFRENRDRIVAALEVQIKNDKSTNEMLKQNLDQQMAENVKLKSQNAAAMAEISELKKQEKSSLRKSISSSAVLNLNPVVEVKREPISPPPAAQEAPLSSKRQSRKKTQTPTKVAEIMTATHSGTSEEEPPAEKKRASGRSKRGPKRGSSTGSRGGSKRGKRTTRPATPLPEVPSAEEEEEIASPPKRVRKSGNRNVAIKSEQLATGQGVLDDSELLRETGNAREFPEPALEIDVTPNLSKKAAKSRKRAAKKEELGNESEDAEIGTTSTTRTSTRRKTRANTNNNSNSSNEDQPPATVSASRNLTKVGSLIRNSPVGHALKCIEEAISPATKSPKKAKKQPEEQSKRTRRLVKLHPDDISSPLEATPSPEHTRDAVFHSASVSDTPARMIRRLRNRK